MMTGGMIGDEDSGLDIDPDTADIEENTNFDPDILNINLKVSSRWFFLYWLKGYENSNENPFLVV